MKAMTIQDALTMSEEQIYDYFRTPNSREVTNHYMYIDNGHKICLVAHVDTCTRKEVVLMEKNGVIRNKMGLLGADDRAGIYGLAKLRDTGCNLLITSQEETGGIGAKKAALDLEMTGVTLMIELDRKGCNDWVYYGYSVAPETKKYIESYGYIESHGSYSDISEFPHMPAVNLSIGYYDQHTHKECLHVDEMELNIARVRRMIANPPSVRPAIPAGTTDWDYYKGWTPSYTKSLSKSKDYYSDLDWTYTYSDQYQREVYDWSKRKTTPLDDRKEEVFSALIGGMDDIQDIHDSISLADSDLLYEIEEQFQELAYMCHEHEWRRVFNEVWRSVLSGGVK